MKEWIKWVRLIPMIEYSIVYNAKIIKIGLLKHLPNIIYDQFFDFHTLFKIKGIDTNINREEFGLISKDNAYVIIN